jgi:hypothetical protein
MTASGWHRLNRNTPAQRAKTRKYNSAEHKAARARDAALVATGRARCWRCGRHIPPGSKWHSGHNDLGDQHMGPEHDACNIKAAAAKGARIANAKRRRPIRMPTPFQRPLR